MTESKPQWPWQTMDTAPKDGTPVLIAQRNGLNGEWFVITAQNLYVDYGEDRWVVLEGIETACSDPALWAPLPSIEPATSPIPPERVPEALRELARMFVAMRDFAKLLAKSSSGLPYSTRCGLIDLRGDGFEVWLREEASRFEAELAGKKRGGVSSFMYFECPECGFDSIQCDDFRGSTACPLCAGDSGNDVRMNERPACDDDKPEGFDARKGIRDEQRRAGKAST